MSNIKKKLLMAAFLAFVVCLIASAIITSPSRAEASREFVESVACRVIEHDAGGDIVCCATGRGALSCFKETKP